MFSGIGRSSRISSAWVCWIAAEQDVDQQDAASVVTAVVKQQAVEVAAADPQLQRQHRVGGEAERARVEGDAIAPLQTQGGFGQGLEPGGKRPPIRIDSQVTALEDQHDLAAVVVIQRGLIQSRPADQPVAAGGNLLLPRLHLGKPRGVEQHDLGGGAALLHGRRGQPGVRARHDQAKVARVSDAALIPTSRRRFLIEALVRALVEGPERGGAERSHRLQDELPADRRQLQGGEGRSRPSLSNSKPVSRIPVRFRRCWSDS